MLFFLCNSYNFFSSINNADNNNDINNNNNNNNSNNNNKDNNNNDNNNGNYNENKLIIIATINLFNWRVILDNVF